MKTKNLSYVEIITGLLMAFMLTMAVPSSGQTITSKPKTPQINNQDKVGQFGLGVQVGGQTGLTVDYWDSSATSWVGGVGGQLGYGNVSVNADRLWHFPGTFGRSARELVPYLGGGILGVFGRQNDFLRDRTQSAAFALQVPFGLDYLPATKRFSVFAELKPSLEVAPDAFAFLNVDLGARFYF